MNLIFKIVSKWSFEVCCKNILIVYFEFMMLQNNGKI